jgi:hypothetical protein
VTNFVAPRLGTLFEIEKNVYDFQKLFLVPCAVAIFAAIILLVFFHPPKRSEANSSGASAPAH